MNEFVFAPEERYVYSYDRVPSDLAPLGAKPEQRNLGRGRQKRLRSYRASEQRKNRQAINISPLWGDAVNKDLLHFKLEFTSC